MKNAVYILILLFFAEINCFSQDSTVIRTGTNYSASTQVSKYFIILDGVPIFKTKRTINYIDTTSIDSIIIHKQIIKNSRGKQVYNAFIEIRSIDSLNQGLKYIQTQTDNWIFKFPLANLSINGKKTKWVKIFRNESLISNSYLITKIELIEPNSEKRKQKNGLINFFIKE